MGGADSASPSTAFQYKAFISYAHEDVAYAERLQKALEAYRIDEALHGFPTRVGAIPENLRPIFRDKTDFVAAVSLTEELRRTLAVSQFLIVVCSPAAAASKYVNEEIRYFRELGRDDKILALIVDGVPGDPLKNCFPSALREPLAADAGKVRDDWDRALLQLVGGLLGLPLGVVEQRQRERRTRERYFWGATVGTLALLAAVAGLSAYQWRQANERMRGFVDGIVSSAGQLVLVTGRLADGMGISAAAAIELLQGIEGLSRYSLRQNSDNPEAQAQHAVMFLDLARHFGRLRQPKQQERAVQHAVEHIESLMAQNGPYERTLLLLAEAHRLLGDAYFSDGKYQPALVEFEKGLEVIEEVKKLRIRSRTKAGRLQRIAYYRSAENTAALGELEKSPEVVSTSELPPVSSPVDYIAKARLIIGRAGCLWELNERRKALEVAAESIRSAVALRLDFHDEKDREAGEILVDARYRVADMIRQLNDENLMSDVKMHIDEGLKVAERLHEYQPRRASLQQKLANLYLARGDLHRWRAQHQDMSGAERSIERQAALEQYQKARLLREQLSTQDTTDLTLKADFGLSLIKVAEEANALGRWREAIPEFETAQKLYAALQVDRVGDLRFRHWEWTAYQGLAEAYRRAGDVANEMKYNKIKVEKAWGNHRHAPDDLDFVLDLGESYRNLGDALILNGTGEKGLKNLEEAHSLLKPFAAHPNADWRLRELLERVIKSIERHKRARPEDL